MLLGYRIGNQLNTTCGKHRQLLSASLSSQASQYSVDDIVLFLLTGESETLRNYLHVRQDCQCLHPDLYRMETCDQIASQGRLGSKIQHLNL